MRRHAKASTAGSTQRQAKGLGRFLRGVGVTSGTPLTLIGSSAPRIKRILVFPIVLSLAAGLCLVCGVGGAAAVTPTISSTSASGITMHSAVLAAQINPEGEATTYHFEYGLADCASDSCASSPLPNGNVGSSSSEIKVSNEIAGLSPDTTYHYRVVANNGSGIIAGPDSLFKTYGNVMLDSRCPNRVFRYGPGALLPDCRAFELVSPLDKNGADIAPGEGVQYRGAYNQSALDGNRLTYSNYVPFGDAKSARGTNQYVATRSADGWFSHSIDAMRGKTVEGNTVAELSFNNNLANQFKFFTPDLSIGLVTDNNKTTLTPEASQNYPNLYRRDNLTESYEAVTNSTPTVAAPLSVLELYSPEVQGVSSDASDVVFMVAGALTANAANNQENQVYLYSDGELHLVSVLPDGTAAATPSSAGFSRGGSEVRASYNHTLSDDSSRVFWSSGSDLESKNLYVRKNPEQQQSAISGSNECTEPEKACTVQIGTGVFWAASADGSKALTGKIGETLFEYDVNVEASTPIAGEVTGVLGASDDLSYVYLTSKEVLDGGATAGQPNVYLRHNGEFSFIATLAASETGTVVFGTNHLTVDNLESLYRANRVTPDGRHLAFESTQSLTGYDNTDAVNGKSDMEVYLYDADSNELTCVSCNPTGARPTGQGLQVPYSASRTIEALLGEQRWAAAWLQTAVHPLHPSRALSDDGSRLYFNSFDSLVAGDTNGAQDVYQWEVDGTGSCEKVGGCVSLISTGANARKSEFVEASANGRDVFIETSSSIDPRDLGLIDIYDVREGGGLQLPPAPPSPCVGDACQSIPSAPSDRTSASAGFRGAGNLTRRRNCSLQARRAEKLGAQAKRLRSRARRASTPAQADRLRQRSVRLEESAKGTSQSAVRCRRANRRAGG